MSNYTYLTQGGYDKIKADLEELKTNGRMEAAHAIAEAAAPHADGGLLNVYGHAQIAAGRRTQLAYTS